MMTQMQINLKLRDNIASICNKLNKELLKKDYSAKLYTTQNVAVKVRNRAKKEKCSELQASEILKAELNNAN